MKRIIPFVITAALLLTSCSKKQEEEYPVAVSDNYRTYYEIYVGAFYDSDGDGTGDLKGLIEKLDYLNDGDNKTSTDLGIDGIWLMPISNSPSYHKYDVTDYYSVDSQFGTMEDFENLIEECDKRGIKVITDFVFNHTSSEHPWFQSAVNSIIKYPDGECFDKDNIAYNPYCDYYNFSMDTSGGVYYQVGSTGWYYEAPFWSGMPDLDLSNPSVYSEIMDIADFWLQKGIGGFRLDAVIHYFNQNNTKNTEFLKKFCDDLREKYPDIYIVGEAWTSDSVISDLYKSGINSLFNFGFSNSDGDIIKSILSGKGNSLAQSFEDWQKQIKSSYPDSIDAVFLSNHDNGRSAGALRRDTVYEKMAAGVYILSPGNPFIYYGEEIGMTGSGIDENKRQPMVWSYENTEGTAKPVAGSTNNETPENAVDTQLKDENSLLSYYRDAIRLRNLNPEIARGTVTSVDTGNDGIFALEYVYEEEKVYVIHNLSKDENNIVLDASLFGNAEIRGNLTASEGKVTFKDGKLTMPQYSTVILKKQGD